MPTAPVLRTFVQYFIAFCSRPEAASDMSSGRFVRLAVVDKCVNFHDPHLNCSREIAPEAVACGNFDRFSNVDNFRPEVASDVIFGAIAKPTGMKVHEKLGDSR